jgi:hypothetical protein
MIKGKLANIIGNRFGRLVTKSIAGRNKQRQLMVKCLCDCGKQPVIRGYALIYGVTRSCGCFNQQLHKEIATKHDLSRTRFYRIWQGIKQRCNNPKDTAYKNYGGRGIIVCPAWQNSFVTFCLDTFIGYDKFLTIDRIDNNGPYCPFNCRWITQQEQCRNSRRNKLITINNETKTLAEWLDIYNINRSTYGARVRIQGMTPQQALTKSVCHQ